MRQFGLIGFPLGHSFSKDYFTKKFEQAGIDASYQNFELEDITGFNELLQKHPELEGLNVTIPHKQAVMEYLDELSPEAKEINAVNVIKIAGGKTTGYNTDYLGFMASVKPRLNGSHKAALVLGTGGAAKAVAYGLEQLEVPYRFVSRDPGRYEIGYKQLSETLIADRGLIINTTPLGMYPKVEDKPNIPYEALSPDHLLMDLIYNPEETAFLRAGKAQGAQTLNGAEMLRVQAEEAWKIWNS